MEIVKKAKAHNLFNYTPQGIRCDECKNGFFSLSNENPEGCTACNCNPVGSTSIFCDPVGGQCVCKTRVQGLKCDECKDGFFNFTNGCDNCLCNAEGKESGTVCEKASGRCTCKSNVEGGSEQNIKVLKLVFEKMKNKKDQSRNKQTMK